MTAGTPCSATPQQARPQKTHPLYQSRVQTVTLPTGDVNGNGCVDDADLLAILFNFGGNDPRYDLTGDGSIDDADLLTVLFNFGSGC